MQPNSPSVPRPPAAAPRPGSSIGSGFIVGILVLFALIYLFDHAGSGEVAVFGGVDRRIATQDFRRAGCTAIFGGCKIDLRDAQMQGSEAVLDTYAIFGGVEVRVPEDWEVVNRGVAILGGISEHRRHSGSASKTLYVQGAAVFGGVEVKD